MKIAILGGGNMAQAMVTAFLKKKIVLSSDLLVAGRNAEKLKWFAARKITVLVGPRDLAALQNRDVIFLAVKPQDMAGLLESVRDFIPPKALVISIAAGITIRRLQSFLPGHKIVRCMPNTPAQIQKGMTGWIANRLVTASDKKNVKKLFDSFGYSVYFSDEKKLDAVTAVSGAGPAYVFYFIESLVEGARCIGLQEKTALRLAEETFLGAVMLLQHSGESPSALRQKVTSKKGVTEQAIDHMMSKKVHETIAEAIKKALRRTKELNT